MNLLITSITIGCVIGISLGQLLFKKAAMALPATATWQHWVFNPWLIFALALYGIMFKHPLCVSLMPVFGLATVVLELIILKIRDD